MTNWFSGCLHLGHEKILKGYRGQFFKTIEEHDSYIIEGILSSCKKGDNYYCLGDIFWKWGSDRIKEFFDLMRKNRINFFWIIGNHDKNVISSWFYSAHIKDITIEGQPITLCHYPLLVWNKSHFNAWNLHAHVHFNDATYPKLTNDIYTGKRLNVGVEFNAFKPITFEQVKEKMTTKKDNFDLIKNDEFYKEFYNEQV